MERIPCRHTSALCFAARATCATWENVLVVVARVPGGGWCYAYRSRFDSSDMAIDCARGFFEVVFMYRLNERRCTVVARRLESVHDV
jgi:hypothetical protein